MDKKIVVECTKLEKKYFLFDRDYKILTWMFTKKGCSKELMPLTDINLKIYEGDVIGFIGKNGAGKSTLMKIISGITKHTDGNLYVNGKVNSLINLSAGFNPKYTGRQNIYYKALLMGMAKKQVDEIIDEIIDFCELGDYFELPLYMYSSGMSARLGFALAIFTDHDILIVDEVFSVGDKRFREKSAKKMEELFKSGKSIIFVSHSDEQIRQFCNRAIFINESKIALDGSVEEVLRAYNQKYSANKDAKNSDSIKNNSKKELKKEFKNEFEKSDRFMKIINTTMRVGKVELLREIAILNEYNEEFENAYKYMKMANNLRPEGKSILKNLKEYETKIDVNSINFDEKDTLEHLSRICQMINNRNNPFGKTELYRELGLFYELQKDDNNALKYMGYAKELRPKGQFIVQKYDEYINKQHKL